MTIPSYGAIQLLRRAVDSILAQTHRNLTLLVINDGNPTPLWPALADIDDARLVRFDMDTNRGRYFADGVAIAATDAPTTSSRTPTTGANPGVSNGTSRAASSCVRTLKAPDSR